MDEFTPTNEFVKGAYLYDRAMIGSVYNSESGPEFDRWLAAHDAEIHREGYSDAICHIYPTADDDAEILDQFMDGYETPTRYQAKDGAQ